MNEHPLLMDANTPMMRRARTGMSDEQLATLGYISVLWNALERNLVAAIWTAADWTQETGELVTADLANVSRANLLMNLMRSRVDDERLLDLAQCTVALCDHLRSARNDLMHGFYIWTHQSSSAPPALLKVSAKRQTGNAEIKSVSVDLQDLKEFAQDIALCEEAFNDLRHMLHFRNRWNAGERGTFAQDYENAVHGWRAPSFDISFVQECLKKRSQRLNPPQPKPQRKASQRKSLRLKPRPD